MLLEIRVKTNAKETKILEKNDLFWKIAIAEKPIDGEANKELIRFLEKELKKKVEIVAGKTSKKKLIKII